MREEATSMTCKALQNLHITKVAMPTEIINAGPCVRFHTGLVGGEGAKKACDLLQNLAALAHLMIGDRLICA